MKSSAIKSSGYENIVVDCPLCDHEKILNRATDLCTFEPISGTNMSCQECEKEFWINGDVVNERHEAIIFDCHDLLRTKRYMNCILSVSQAYEMFFGLYLRVNLIYRPFGKEVRQSRKGIARSRNTTGQLNELCKELSEATKYFGFAQMREVTLGLAVQPNRPSGLDESKSYINDLPQDSLPKDSEIASLPDNRIAQLFLRIKRTKINELRNKVVHESAYRPKRVEAEDAVAEARAVLFPLTYKLDLHDDVNWYFSGNR